MDITSWFQLAIICLLGAMSPGPSLALVISNTVSRGRVFGIATSLGHATGIGWWALLTAIGITELIGDQKTGLLLLQVAGIFLLAYIGMRTITDDNDLISVTTGKPKSDSVVLIRGATEGFLISLLNPKVALFFLVIFSHFVFLESTRVDVVIMGITAALIDAGWYVFVVLILTSNKFSNNFRLRGQAVKKFSGAMLILISLYLLIMMVLGL
tara:strand:- start:1420 stop:2055 length:636 start_codon:yes stop_codon:yes gene_type:complete